MSSLPACSMHTSQYSDGENRRGGRSGRTLHGSSSSAGRPRQVAADRARAGEKFLMGHFPASPSMSRLAGSSAHRNRTGGRRWSKSRAHHPPAHAATSLHSLTRFQPGHQPENWRALQEEETAHGSVSISSGTSGRCSCRNFGTCIITLMHLRVLYVVMDCSGTSVRSARRRRGAKPLAVAAAAGHCRRRRCGVPAAVCCGSGALPSTVCLFSIVDDVPVIHDSSGPTRMRSATCQGAR